MTEATYSGKAFISKDVGVDINDRAEVKVTMGYGDIHEVELSDKGKSANVTFKVSNTKFKSNGWAPVGGNVLEKVEEAKKAGVPIYFRIEVRRKDGVDRSKPILEISTLALAKDNVVKSLAAVRISEDDEWTISSHAKTNIAEDSYFGGAAAGGGSANKYSLEELQGGSAKSSSSESSSSVNHYGIEGTPFMTFNKDKSLNVGSAAVAVPLNLFSFVVEYERTHVDALGALTDKQRINTAKVLLSAANQLQIAIYDGKLESPDLGLGSHTRARAIIFEVIRTFYPLTASIAGDKELLKAWRDDLVTKSLGMWKWSISEVEKLV